MSHEFLTNTVATKRTWRDTLAAGLEPRHYWIGTGRDALEIAYATATTKPTFGDVRAAWKKRHGQSAAPLLLIVAYPDGAGGARALACGPSGDAPRVVDMDLGQAERLADGALREPNRHQATEAVTYALERVGDGGGVPGLVNRGLLATHELLTGVPSRSDWEQAGTRGRAIAQHREQSLLRSLGFELEPVGDHHVLRTNDGSASAVAIVLLEEERPDLPSFRFGMQTPVSFALSRADRDNLPWVISIRGGTLRLYSSSSSGAVGQRGRSETFVELDLGMLPSDKVAYLHLLFSTEALATGGSLYEIQSASRDFMAGLATRLRERVYDEAVPRLATVVARQLGGTTAEDLADHYKTALTILFRLLFIAYAEDSHLLPLHVNAEYTDASLKRQAQRLSAASNDGTDLGFDDPISHRATTKPDTNNDDLWRGCLTLFRAVDKGHDRWGVPAYNGGLFNDDPAVNPTGARIRQLNLTNDVFGPVLLAVTADRAPDDTVIGPIDFRSLSVREFGTIYEGLLESELSVAEQDLTLGSKDDYLPAKAGDDVAVKQGEVYLHNASGQRKSTGSYFTKPFAVDHLLEHALDPTLKVHLERVAKLLEQGDAASAAEALFDFRVADISMGSGHFLTAVVDRIEAHVSDFLTDHPIPALQSELDRLRKQAMDALGANAAGVEIETAALVRRLIARRCVYGVDLNPVSVELARVSMWIHTFVPGLPLSFLDHNLTSGDSLTGIGTLEEALSVLEQGQGPKSSFQAGMFNDPLRDALAQAQAPLERMAKLVDATPKDVAAARATHEEVRTAIEPVTAFFDLTVAVRLGHAKRELIDSPEKIAGLVGRAADRSHAREMRAVHFPIAFPEVFLRERPGFDVIVGNPPWSEVTVEERQFWSRHSPGLKAMEEADALAAMERLRSERPDLARDLARRKQASERLRAILHAGPFPGFETGDPDLYKAFSWRFLHLVRSDGAISVALPRSVFTTKGSKQWRQAALPESITHVVTLRNTREWVFDDVNPGYTVCLVTVVRGAKPSSASLRLFGRYESIEEFTSGLRDGGATVAIAALDSEGGLTLPDLSTEGEVRLFERLLATRRVGEGDRTDFRVRPDTDFHATNDRNRTGILKPDGDTPVWNHTNIDHFRFAPENGEFIRCDSARAFAELHERRTRSLARRGGVFQDIAAARGKPWAADPQTHPARHPRIAFRDVVHASNPRKVWAALLPSETLLTNKAPYLLFAAGGTREQAYLLGILNSSVCDWFGHLFIGLNLNYFIFNNLPVPVCEPSDQRAERVAALATTLAVNERGTYGDFAKLVIPNAPDRSAMLAELDGLASLLYGLSDDDLPLVWNSDTGLRPPLEQVIAYRNEWNAP